MLRRLVGRAGAWRENRRGARPRTRAGRSPPCRSPWSHRDRRAFPTQSNGTRICSVGRAKGPGSQISCGGLDERWAYLPPTSFSEWVKGEGEQKASINLMNLRQLRQQAVLMHLAPRCSATSKRTGYACEAPAVRGRRVCHKHGAGAPPGQRNGMYRHGGRTKQAQAERRYVAELMRAAREAIGATSRE